MVTTRHANPHYIQLHHLSHSQPSIDHPQPPLSWFFITNLLPHCPKRYGSNAVSVKPFQIKPSQSTFVINSVASIT